MTGPVAAPSTLRIASIYPELLGTYGDGGNAVILAARARWRGLAAELVEVRAGEPIPGGCDIYLLGGGEDEPQALAAAGARTSALAGAVAGGAVLLAVCAGLQIVGLSFPATDGRIHPGAELVDVTTVPGEARAVGDLVVRPRAGLASGLSGELLYGYENHGGRTTLGPGVAPLGAVVRGIGNGAGQADEAGAYEGLWAPTGAGLVVGTYLHGPVLAQNPQLAEAILERVAPGLPPLDEADPRVAAAAAAATALRGARARQTARR